jgi:hypothetical protein
VSRIPGEHVFFWVCVTWCIPLLMIYAGGAWADAGIWVAGAVIAFWVSRFARRD